jgi:hypothetical protein
MPPRSRNDVLKHASVHVGQPEVPAGVSIGEAFVVDAKQVQDRCVKIVGVCCVCGSADPVFV